MFEGITSKHDGDFYYLNCFDSYSKENKLKNHKHVCENHDRCCVETPKEDKIFKYNHGEKSMKVPFIIYADMVFLVEKMSTCHNPKKSSTTKISKHTPSGCSLFTHCRFDTIKNKFDYYRGKDCMKSFCKDFKKHATEIINFEKKNKWYQCYQMKKINHISSKNFIIYVKKNITGIDNRSEIMFVYKIS